jgi:hypothetical protein
MLLTSLMHLLVAEAVTLTVENNIPVTATVPLTTSNFFTTRDLFEDPVDFYQFIETL